MDDLFYDLAKDHFSRYDIDTQVALMNPYEQKAILDIRPGAINMFPLGER